MDCRLQHFGVWFIEDTWFVAAVNSVASGVLKPRMFDDAELDDVDEVDRGPNGMAIVNISGHMVKGRSSFGGASTVSLRRRIRMLANDDRVPGIMLRIESPGGTAEGTFELAEEVRKANDLKPVVAHIEDIGASAAYWVASQARRITANAPAEVGSIGAVAVLVDSSEAAANVGIKVHVISTGEFKAAGAPGTKITDAQLAMFQERIDDAFEFFLVGVERGRGLTGRDLAAVATGRVWVAEKALRLGLIDSVMSWDEAVQQFAAELAPTELGFDRRRRAQALALELEIGG